jgi:hypothetical protein
VDALEEPEFSLPAVEAYFAGRGDLESAAQELISRAGNNGFMFSVDLADGAPPEERSRALALEARVNALHELRTRPARPGTT